MVADYVVTPAGHRQCSARRIPRQARAPVVIPGQLGDGTIGRASPGSRSADRDRHSRWQPARVLPYWEGAPPRPDREDALLSDPTAEYHDLGADYYEKRRHQRREVSTHLRGLQRLGYKVTLEPVEGAA